MQQIRLAEPKDIEAMAGLLAILFEQEAEFVPNERQQKDGLSSLLNNPHWARLIVMEEFGTIVAMLSLQYAISTALGGRVAVLEDMVVAPDARGRGLGQDLLRYAIQQAQNDGCLRITLLTDSDNSAAHKLYQSAGFYQSSMVAFRKMLPTRQQ